jgi:class 3 adenylate cyclase
MTFLTGTINFLFTDIEGSTKLAQEHPDALPVLLALNLGLTPMCMQSEREHKR